MLFQNKTTCIIENLIKGSTKVQLDHVPNSGLIGLVGFIFMQLSVIVTLVTAHLFTSFVRQLFLPGKLTTQTQFS